MVNNAFKFFAGIFGTVAMVAACAPVSILNGITPSSSFNKTKNEAYGTEKYEILDVYRTEKPRADAPVLVFVHGGSWDSGSKNIYKFLAEAFTSSGYDIVVPNYRLYPEAIFPNFIEDNAKAVAYVQKTFPDRQIVLMGHSAGAYNVLMLALRDEYLDDAGVNRCEKIAGVVALAPPTGVVPLTGPRLIEIFPDRFLGEDAVLNNVNAPSPPLFLGHGESDTTVYPQNSTQLAEKVAARGGVVEVKVYEGQSHIDVVKVLSRHFDGKVTLKADILAFIEALPETNQNCR
nr:esterase [uncultured bacterium]